ncbi:hypothetical protein KC950_00050 [Candidatus Saccharibacteria bacterium]|nr:hypothetical protein [Candidatus Saccharibacteria bacterium]
MRKLIAGGLVAAGAIGLGVGGYQLGESLNDSPEGNSIDKDQAVQSAALGYIALASDECEATVLRALSTIDDEWYEPPKSKGTTYNALVEACPNPDLEQQESLAEEASLYYKTEVAPAINSYDKAIDSEKYDFDEKLIFAYLPFATAGVLALIGTTLYSQAKKEK